MRNSVWRIFSPRWLAAFSLISFVGGCYNEASTKEFVCSVETCPQNSSCLDNQCVCDEGWIPDGQGGCAQCLDGEERTGETACGPNGNGRRIEECISGAWALTDNCEGQAECLIGSEREEACGPNGAGRRTQVCDASGTWGPWSDCQGVDECENGATASGEDSCGIFLEGRILVDCINGQWEATETCSHEEMCADLASHYQTNETAPTEPPFWGTIFTTSELLDSNDPTSYDSLSYVGQGERIMYDRRVANWVTETPHLFNVQFGAAKQIEFQVNPEFTREEAEREVVTYAGPIGRIPGFLLRDVQTVWIHRGNNAFGGGNNNLLIHTEQGESYQSSGILEETFIHEATHTSVDQEHQDAPLWVLAQEMDGAWISHYAQDYPQREDLAESMLLYLAAVYWKELISDELYETIVTTIPNRIRYFQCQGFTSALLD